MRVGSACAGVLLVTPITHLVIQRALDVLLRGAGVAPEGVVSVALQLSTLATAALAAVAVVGLRIHGAAWFRIESEPSRTAEAVSLGVVAASTAVVATDAFLDALSWGVDRGDPLLTGIGTVGVGAVVWVVVRSLLAFEAGLRGNGAGS